MEKEDKDEVEKRRDDALLRALTTPPKPHKPIGSDGTKRKTAKPAKRA